MNMRKMRRGVCMMEYYILFGTIALSICAALSAFVIVWLKGASVWRSLGWGVSIGLAPYLGLWLLAGLFLAIECVCKLITRNNTVVSAAKQEPNIDKRVSYLDAGANGEVRTKLQTDQVPLEVEQVRCRLYLPKDWEPDTRICENLLDDAVALMAGPREHEWISVRYMHSAEASDPWCFDAVEFVCGEALESARGRIMFKPHPAKNAGVDFPRRFAWENEIEVSDSKFCAFHHVLETDAMDACTGTFEIENRLYRIISVAIVSGCDCWRFEYAFPAADGVTPESLDLRPEEIETARRIFVPIETVGCDSCPDISSESKTKKRR